PETQAPLRSWRLGRSPRRTLSTRNFNGTPQVSGLGSRRFLFFTTVQKAAHSAANTFRRFPGSFTRLVHHSAHFAAKLCGGIADTSANILNQLFRQQIPSRIR